MKSLPVWLVLLARVAWGTDCSTLQESDPCGAPIELNPPQCRGGVCTYVKQSDITGTGTITTTLGSLAVVGSGTDFVNQLNLGWAVTASGQSRIVSAITDATNISLADDFVPAIAAGTTYTILPPIERWMDTSGNTLYVLTADGRIGLRKNNPAASLDIRLPQPSALSTGAFGISGIDGVNIVSQSGGNTTSAGAFGGTPGSMTLAVGNAGSQPANGINSRGGSPFTISGGRGADISSGTGGTAGNGSAVQIAAGPGGAAGSSNTNGTGGILDLDPGASGNGAGTAGAAGSVRLATLTAGAVLSGLNAVRVPHLQVFSSTTDGNVASTTDVEVLTSSVLTQASFTESLHVNVRLNNAAAGARQYTCTLRRGGSSCTSGSTLVTDSQGRRTVGNGEVESLTWEATETSPGTQTTTYRVCCLSSSATGTQTTEYQQLDVFEF